jgi:hypothetical protein
MGHYKSYVAKLRRLPPDVPEKLQLQILEEASRDDLFTVTGEAPYVRLWTGRF